MGFSLNLCVFFFLVCFLVFSSSSFGDTDHQTMTYTSFNVSATRLNPYDWRYIEVYLPPPPSYASASIEIESDVNLNLKKIDKKPKRQLPMICFRHGGPPLPDVSNAALNGLVLNQLSNGSAGDIQNLENVEQCFPLQKKLTFKLTSRQIMPGVYYIGLFNGIGPVRTQSKMINRGSAYSFSANIKVEGCSDPTMWGQYCNQTVEVLSSVQSNSRAICINNMELNVYSLDVMETAEQLRVIANDSSFSIMFYARYNAIPDKDLHDYSTDISKGPLVIHLPRAGTWYFAVEAVINSEICFSMEWEILTCPEGKAGSNCTWERHILQEIPTKNQSVPIVYFPNSENVPSETDNFSLNPLLSKYFQGDRSDYAWTYFLLNTTSSGENIDIQLISDTKLSYELYARFGGLPSLDIWDYRYLNQTSNSNNSMFKLYDTSEERINLSILYPTEGLWTIGLRHPLAMDNSSSPRTTMSVSIQTCPNNCSDHGTCLSRQYSSGSTYYSFCSCDRNHGGVDCNVYTEPIFIFGWNISHILNVVSPETNVDPRWHSIFLIASNAAALLPAFKVLQKKAGAEWVIFMSSGISSALYHACDVGFWCALPYPVLQFMDFWLSFLAVVSTFVYLTVMSEAARGTIRTLASIITAILAVGGATRSQNIEIVLAIGALAFLVGWLMQFCPRYKSFSFPSGSSLKIHRRWQTFKVQFLDLMKTIYRHFHWWFVLLGFIAMSIAALSWTKENAENYWIWHSSWHVAIYTSAFFFICSKADNQSVHNEEEAPAAASYELTHQQPLP